MQCNLLISIPDILQAFKKDFFISYYYKRVGSFFLEKNSKAFAEISGPTPQGSPKVIPNVFIVL